MTGAWVLVGPRSTQVALRPLIRAHERHRPVAVVRNEADPPFDPGEWAERLVGADGVLVVGSRRRGPRTGLPGPFLLDATGRSVPAGWLPDAGDDLATFAMAAARVQDRTGTVGPVAILAQWEARYLELADRMEANLAAGDGPRIPMLRWTAERIVREDVATALRSGLGAAVYFGHGRPTGWAGYHGLRAHHLTGRPGEPLGAILSVTCRTASRWRVGLSFSEAVTLGGTAAAAMGAVAPVRHLDNMRWMLGLVRALRDGAIRLGEALGRAAPADRPAREVYRIVGDPLALLLGTEAGARAAAAVWAPAPWERIDRAAGPAGGWPGDLVEVPA